MEGGNGYKKGLWTVEEDRILMDYIRLHGSGKWNRIAKLTGLRRCGKSCRLRWMNYLSPNVKRGDFSEEEDDLIIRLHNLLGNRWSLIAGRVPGRTDNQVKNHWNTHLSKKLGVKKEKSKTKASSQTVLPRESEEKFCIPTSESMDSDDHHQLPSNFINGEFHAGDKVMKDGSQTAVYLTGMWEVMRNDNYESSFCFSNDDDDLNNFHSSFFVESLQEYCSLDFIWNNGL
ncbi:hypothetical protein FEM48_Zijuj05G0075800 [Ziziphus jujuba var. spinosa]|nr:hypothetical protein FEM48_Zijuj05G0075800 [Ziziphus jujuba var. spinosa]